MNKQIGKAQAGQEGSDMIENKEPHCCKIDCQKAAEWEIWAGNAPDDFTHACTEHVGNLLTVAPIHYVYPLHVTRGE